MRRFSFMSAIAVAAFVIVAQSAAAATTIGQAFDPTSGGVCNPSPRTFLQTAPAQYVAPFDGVITSWSYQAAASPPQLKLKVGRALSGTQFLIVGESSVQSPTANQLNTYPTRISVKGGDVLGFTMTSDGECFRSGAGPTYVSQTLFSDPAPGTSPTFGSPQPDLQFDIAARLEADCDSDGLGDESQDTNILSCDKTAPETVIGKKTVKGTTAKFEFTSNEPGSSFQCKLDKHPFKPCSSPKKYKHLSSGKHKFKVRAADASGNVDASAAKKKFKI
jgi:hypothetical protein